MATNPASTTGPDAPLYSNPQYGQLPRQPGQLPGQPHPHPQPPPFARNVAPGSMGGVVGLGRDGLPHLPSATSAAPDMAGQQQDPARDPGFSEAAAAHPSPAAPQASSAAFKPIRRRMRMITSCLECRRRKLKCNKSQPCTNCLKFSRECVFLGSKLDEASQMRLAEMKEKVGSLERQLERDVAKSASHATHQHGSIADDVDDDVDEESNLEITPLVALDLTYDTYDTYDTQEDNDRTDEIIDLGIQVGRMRITERIGGLNRPRISEEIKAGLADEMPPPDHRVRVDAGPEAAGPETSSVPKFLGPTDSYIAPTSGLFFGQLIQPPGLGTALPSREAGDFLLRQYFDAVHPIARCVHRPSFEAQYAQFWECISRRCEPRPSAQALVFAAWFSAVVSMEEAVVAGYFGYEWVKKDLVNTMKIKTEAALSRASFLRTTSIDTMQAFVMYMIPLCRAEISRSHSVLVGAAVRMAECLGLHRDGEAYGLAPLETHVRRLLWHQICFLDIRTCEAQGPRPAIRREDYDTKLPVNCEEDALSPHPAVPPAAAEAWTSNMLPIIRFEINEMMRIIWTDRRRLETRKTTLAAVLAKIENFRKRMLDKYGRFLDEQVPIQRYAKRVMLLLIYRLHAMTLHPYHSNTSSPMPQRLNSVLIASGVSIIEISIQLETEAVFRDWAWYLGAYQQYQIALLLATELYYRPGSKDADRIWACLDYVFNLDPAMPREHKTRAILAEIMTKTNVYQSMRKMRGPTATARAVPGKQAVRSESPPPRSAMPPAPEGVKAEPGAPPPPGGMAMPTAPQPPPYAPPPRAAAAPVAFAGVSNGEVIWTVPQAALDGSENSSSDGGSVAGYPRRGGGGGGDLGAMSLDNIDWDTLNTILPIDPRTGDVSFSALPPSNMEMRWPS